MPREVTVDSATFIVNNFSSADATETAEEILKRVIIKNAEIELKKRPFTGHSKAYDSQPE